MKKPLSVNGKTHIGLRRDLNEDAFLLHEKHPLIAVADGMGGHLAGEVAASEAIAHLKQSIESLFTSNENPLSKEKLKAYLRRAIRDANSWVHHLSLECESREGMGTTLLCGILHDNHFIYGHVGDSRLYHFRDTLEQVTKDHIKIHPVQPTSRSKKILRPRHFLTKAMGPRPTIKPDVNVCSVEKGDILLLCSDGLTDGVDHDKIEKIISNRFCSLEERNEMLINAALESGGRDNITTLLCEVSG